MTPARHGVLPVLALVACAAGAERPGSAGPPVLQGEPVVAYPPEVYERGVSGSVELRLFVDSTGAVVPDSAVLVRSSGHPALDSAALAAAPTLRYAAGTRNGRAIGMPFLQEFHFRHPMGPDSLP